MQTPASVGALKVLLQSNKTFTALPAAQQTWLLTQKPLSAPANPTTHLPWSKKTNCTLLWTLCYRLQSLCMSAADDLVKWTDGLHAFAPMIWITDSSMMCFAYFITDQDSGFSPMLQSDAYPWGLLFTTHQSHS